MSMMELQAALGGGGPPGGGPAEIPIPGGPPGMPPEGPPPEEEGGSSIDYLDDAEAALQQFIQVDPDEIDRAKAGKALQIILDLKAANQKSNETGDLKSLRRALGPGPGGPPFNG